MLLRLQHWHCLPRAEHSKEQTKAQLCMDPNHLLRASQKSPLRTIYGRSNRSLFAPMSAANNVRAQNDETWQQQQQQHQRQQQQQKRSASESDPSFVDYAQVSPAPHRTLHSRVSATPPFEAGNNVTLEQHYASLNALDARLVAIQERNDRLLGHVSAQQNQIERLQSTLDNKMHSQMSMGAPSASFERVRQLEEPVTLQRNRALNADSVLPMQHAPLALAILTVLLLLIVVVVLVAQWRARLQSAEARKQANENSQRSRNDVERAVVDVLSRSLLSQNTNNSSVDGPTTARGDALSGALLRSLVASQRNLTSSRASNTLMYGP